MLEQQDMITLPVEYKNSIRETKATLDHIAKAEVAKNRKEYDEFVESIKTTSTLQVSKDNPSGVQRLIEVFMRCVPDHYIYEKLGHVHSWSDEKLLKEFSNDTRTKDLSAQELRSILDMQVRKMYVLRGIYDNFYIEEFYHQVWLLDRDSVFTYYFFTMEHGYLVIVQQLAKLLKPSENLFRYQDVFRRVVWGIVCCSILAGSEDKTSWRKFAEENDNRDIWPEVNWVLRFHENNQGRKAKVVPLKEMLTGETDELLDRIGEFIVANNESICIAYMLIALERAKRINCESFNLFLKAVNAHFGKDYTYRKAQSRYSELKECPGLLNEKSKSWSKARRIVEEWTETFYRCA